MSKKFCNLKEVNPFFANHKNKTMFESSTKVSLGQTIVAHGKSHSQYGAIWNNLYAFHHSHTNEFDLT